MVDLHYCVSDVHQSDSVIHIFFSFFSMIGNYKILNIVPCAIEKILVYFMNRIVLSVDLILVIYPSHTLSPLVTISFWSMSMSLFLFCK